MKMLLCFDLPWMHKRLVQRRPLLMLWLGYIILAMLSLLMTVFSVLTPWQMMRMLGVEGLGVCVAIRSVRFFLKPLIICKGLNCFIRVLCILQWDHWNRSLVNVLWARLIELLRPLSPTERIFLLFFFLDLQNCSCFLSVWG